MNNVSMTALAELRKAIETGNEAEMDRLLSKDRPVTEQVRIIDIELRNGQTQGLTNLYQTVVENGHEAMVHRLMAEPGSLFANRCQYCLGMAIKGGHRALVELLLPAVKSPSELLHAAKENILNGDALGYLAAILNHAQNTDKTICPDHQGLSPKGFTQRQYLATAALLFGLSRKLS